MDYEVQRCARRCEKTDREFTPGEEFYSALVADGSELARHDFALDAWEGPPEGAIGWWKSKMPDAKAKKARLAPNDVILELFEQLAEAKERQDMRYVLALLLARRRIVRIESTQTTDDGETLVVYCPRRDAAYEVAVATPTAERTEEIQQELAALLFADAA
jgi:hypothetical protein